MHANPGFLKSVPHSLCGSAPGGRTDVLAPSIIVIARPEHTPALCQRLATDPAIAVFAACESLHALDAIMRTPPKILALDPSVVTTARGATLVARAQAAQAYADVEVRILAIDETRRPVILEQPGISLEAASSPLHRCGTRQAARVAMTSDIEFVINGECSQLINLSVTGAQVLTAVRLRPDQRLRLILRDGDTQARLGGIVAWASAELGSGALRYRAGMAFTDPDEQILTAFCARHGIHPDWRRMASGPSALCA
jgi:hypothetical protein